MFIFLDVTKLPGYQEIPLNCPTWKQALIEKKNKQLEEDATVNCLCYFDNMLSIKFR